MQAVYHIATLPLFIMLPLLKRPTHNLRLLALYVTFKIDLQYTFSIFLIINQQYFFPSMLLCKSFWEFICLNLIIDISPVLLFHPIINYLQLSILCCLSLKLPLARQMALGVKDVHCTCEELDYGNTFGLRSAWTRKGSTCVVLVFCF